MELIKKSCYECDYAELVNQNGNVLLSGNYYDDKIDEKIEGYIQALCDFEIVHELTENNFVCENCLCPNCNKLYEDCICTYEDD